MAEIPIDFFYDPETVKMMEKKKLSESLNMPAFEGSVDNVPCEFADFTMIYEKEHNIFMESRANK